MSVKRMQNCPSWNRSLIMSGYMQCSALGHSPPYPPYPPYPLYRVIHAFVCRMYI